MILSEDPRAAAARSEAATSQEPGDLAESSPLGRASSEREHRPFRGPGHSVAGRGVGFVGISGHQFAGHVGFMTIPESTMEME